MRLYDLMNRNRFQAINTFLHVVSVDEELQNEGDALKKVRPLHDHVKEEGSIGILPTTPRIVS